MHLAFILTQVMAYPLAGVWSHSLNLIGSLKRIGAQKVKEEGGATLLKAIKFLEYSRGHCVNKGFTGWWWGD